MSATEKPTEGPSVNTKSPIANLPIPPVTILLIGTGGYLLFFIIIFIIRYFARTKGACQNDLCSCGPDGGCCQCLESCSDACTCGTPTVDKCLDACCPRRNFDFVGLILCECCCSPNETCCPTCADNACCSYGDLNCNCACIQPDVNSISCLCCSLGTSNYNRADDDDD